MPALLSRPSLLACLLCAAPVRAQPTAAGAPAGPLRCYVDATRGANLTLVQAKQLCLGAADESPARCFAQARARFTDAQAVRLCAGATSIAPAACARQLETTAHLDDAAIVAYCAALRWPLVSVPEAGAPACIASAHSRTMLSDHDAVRLCSGSASAQPVDCYAWGQTNTALTDLDLIDLCQPVASVPYIPVTQ
jgi:hypothetical protein